MERSYRGLPVRLGLMLVAFAFLGNYVIAQNLPEFNMNNTTINECQGILFDSGGQSGIYGVNENITTVISTGGVLTLNFYNQFCLENNLDFLFVYDGPDSSSPLLGQFTGNNLPPDLIANSGTATFVFTSDNNVSYCGFSMEWNSIQPAPVPPTLSVNTLPVCNNNQIVLNFSSPLQCAWLPSALATVSANGNVIPVTNVSPGCVNNQTSAVTLTLAQAFTFNCNYTIDFYIEIPDACGLIYEFDLTTSFLYNNCGVNATIVSDTPTICPGSCAAIQANVLGCSDFTYAWNNGLPSTAGPHVVCPTVTTTYAVTITEVSTGNTTTKSFTLVVENINLITLDQTVCQSVDDIILQASGVGEWSGPGVVEGTNLFDPDNAEDGLNYVYFETQNCIDSVAITVIPIQTQEITAACPGTAPFQLGATPAGGTWSGPFTTVSGLFDPSVAGSYEVTYTLGSCTDIMVVNVDLIGGPFTLDPICQSVWFDTLSFSPVGGSWTGNGIINSFSGIYAPQDMVAGNNQFTYTINGCNQIFDIFIKEIQIGDRLQSTCPQQPSLFLYDSNPIPAGGVWSGFGITNNSTGLFNPALLANNQTSTVLYTAPNGCVDTTFVFNVQTLVTASHLNFCLTDPAVDLNQDVVGVVLPSTGTWLGAGISQPTPGNWQFTPATAGVGSFTIYYSSNTCQDSVVVKVFPPALEVTQLDFCSTDAPVVLQSNLISGGTWSGNGITDTATGLFDPSVAEPGDFYVYWQSPAGCNDSIAITVEQFQEAAFAGLLPGYCVQDQTVNFSATPNGGILSGSFSVFTFNVEQAGPGSYQVIYTYDGPLCPASAATFDFEIYPALTTQITVSDTLICEDQSTTITVAASGGNPSNAYSYSWSNGGFAVASNTSVPGTSTTISVTTSDGCSPPVTDNIEIEVLPPIEVSITTSDTLCIGETGFATAVVLTPGDFSIAWNGVVAETINIGAGSTRQLQVTDLVNGCTFTEQVTVPSYPNVTASFSLNPNSICIPFSQAGNVNVIDLSQNAVSGLWNFGNGNSFPYTPGQSITQIYPGSGNYLITLSVANSAGCTDSTEVDLCILPEMPVFIPDIFSPNDDGNNDVLFVRGFGLGKIDFRIYNRWGEEVFYTDNASRGWDGQQRGQPASTGSYFYTFKALAGDGTSLFLTGEIALIR